MTGGIGFKEITDEYIFLDSVKGRLCIKEDGKDGKFCDIQGVLQSLREQKCGKLVRHTLSLILCWSLFSVPMLQGKVPDINVQALG